MGDEPGLSLDHRGRPAAPVTYSIVRELTDADLELLAREPRANPSGYEVDRLSERHKGLARLLATGLSDIVAAHLSGYSIGRVFQLRQNPAFQELVAAYTQVDDLAVAEAQETAHRTGITAMKLLLEKMGADDAVDKTTMREALEVSTAMLDRTGHAPVNRSVSVNANMGDLGARLRTARERAKEARTVEPAMIDATPVKQSADG